MTPAERTAKIAELRAEADRLEAEGKRNWPEKVEIGMIFQHEDGEIYMASRAGEDSVAHLTPDCLVCVTDSWPRIGVMYANYSDDPFDGDEAQFTYLGHARGLLTIKTPDAPEPTGAELVNLTAANLVEIIGDLWAASKPSPLDPVEYHAALAKRITEWFRARLSQQPHP